jgi:uroporphyrin-III C-methyltransferase
MTTSNPATTRAEKGKVYLVGAGPGDPDLLTVKALRLLESADVVLHDDLVPEALLQLTHAHALVTSVGKRCGRPRITQAGIQALMIDSARRGLSVVRLKSGDPLIFGRAAEELAALGEAGVPVEIVPGITAAFAAGAALGVPLTDRKAASKLIFVTGHHAADKAGKPVWTGPLPEDATLVVYMPGRDFTLLAGDLVKAGVAADMPCVAISRAATPRQTHVGCRLAKLAELQCEPAPVLLLIGRAIEAALAADPIASVVETLGVSPLSTDFR